MESSTNLAQATEGDWEEQLRALKVDVEGSAKEQGALRRKRGISSAWELLRLVLMYVARPGSLQQTGAWCCLQDRACLSAVAIFYRLRGSAHWLGYLVAQVLCQQRVVWRSQSPVRVRLVDATTVSRPGSHQIDFRVHMSFDLQQMCMDQVEVTDAHSGENLVRQEPQAGEILVADRGYAFLKCIAAVIERTWFIVRTNWSVLSLRDASGQPMDLCAWLRGLTQASECPVWLPLADRLVAVRLIASPLPADQAEQARRRARQLSQSKGHTLHPNTLVAAGFILLVTNLPADDWSRPTVLSLYRLRWQVELYFKRLKSLLTLDQLPVKNEQVAQTFLFGKLLLAMLIDLAIHHTQQECPHWFDQINRPVSVWRLTQFFHSWISTHLFPPVSMETIETHLPQLRRYFTDPPRERTQLLTAARLYLGLLFDC